MSFHYMEIMKEHSFARHLKFGVPDDLDFVKFQHHKPFVNVEHAVGKQKKMGVIISGR